MSRISKTTTAALAGAAAVVLLAGGGGTFALWQADATVETATLTTGGLTVTPSSATWVLNPEPGKKAERGSFPEEFRIVPGDTVRFNNQVKVEATGDNLNALITVDLGFRGADGPVDEAFFDALAAGNSVLVLNRVLGPGSNQQEGRMLFKNIQDGRVQFKTTVEEGSHTFALVSTYALPFEGDHDALQRAQVGLGDVTITARQIP
ncbi:alternate-type signal peptide domain-containing protein [Georgenia yuyongxinii]|uniref:Alternate-type signal peptide domain-containing protein n=1 Tax=Georgenia yuyongxinii TaxID=2589797 RepID=A0A552WM25_9MICO|nr:alternate-type signal peptide domain-containing protein [Georgenia yuyongxinii]TRW43818.1 alternate-type signal peptide domain-containing protein [Georgenia yuyongxinii]